MFPKLMMYLFREHIAAEERELQKMEAERLATPQTTPTN